MARGYGGAGAPRQICVIRGGGGGGVCMDRRGAQSQRAGVAWWASGAMAVPARSDVAAVPTEAWRRSIAEVVARGVWRWREEAAAAAIPRVDLAADGCDFYSLLFRFFSRADDISTRTRKTDFSVRVRHPHGKIGIFTDPSRQMG